MRDAPAPISPEHPASLRRLSADMLAQVQAIGRVERAGLLTRGWTPHQLSLWFHSAIFLLARAGHVRGLPHG